MDDMRVGRRDEIYGAVVHRRPAMSGMPPDVPDHGILRHAHVRRGAAKQQTNEQNRKSDHVRSLRSLIDE
jgi:hypothetical protein